MLLPKWTNNKPSPTIKVYKPDVNELIKPLKDKSTKGTIFIIGEPIVKKNTNG